MTHLYINLLRTDHTKFLMKDVTAFYLLTVIALKANRCHKPSPNGALQNQAFIGKKDFPFISYKSYRCAKKRLTDGGYASFKGTNRGTVATLLGPQVYDINPEILGQAKGKQGAGEGQAGGTKRAEFPVSTNADSTSNYMGFEKSEGQARGRQGTQGGHKEGTNGAPIKNKELKNKNEIKYIVEFLNEVCKKDFKPTTYKTIEKINGRFSEGYTLEDFQKVITTKSRQWMGNKMESWLRPDTLFCQKNFEAYLNERDTVNVDRGNPDDLHAFLEENRRKLREAEAREATGV